MERVAGAWRGSCVSAYGSHHSCAGSEEVLLAELAPSSNGIRTDVKNKIEANLRRLIGVVTKVKRSVRRRCSARRRHFGRKQPSSSVHAACSHGAHVRDAARVDHAC